MVEIDGGVVKMLLYMSGRPGGLDVELDSVLELEVGGGSLRLLFRVRVVPELSIACRLPFFSCLQLATVHIDMLAR